MQLKTSITVLSLWVLGTCARNIGRDGNSDGLLERGDEIQLFVHPGALHTAKDLSRIKAHIEKQEEPWYTAWKHLETGKLAQTTWVSTPQEILVRGSNDLYAENYAYAYRDAHSAYQLSLRWIFSGNSSYADAAAATLDSWSANLTSIWGNEDMFLAAGLYGYQFANAGELLRSYSGWSAANQSSFSNMLGIFSEMNRNFLDNHNDKPNFYYANWDLCNIASLMAIGIFNDNATMYNYAVNYFKYGLPEAAVANGALPFFSIANYTEEGSEKILMQGQEAGRDQAHTLLDFSLLGVIGQQGYNQNVDLYATFDNQILNGYVPPQEMLQ